MALVPPQPTCQYSGAEMQTWRWTKTDVGTVKTKKTNKYIYKTQHEFGWNVELQTSEERAGRKSVSKHDPVQSLEGERRSHQHAHRIPHSKGS